MPLADSYPLAGDTTAARQETRHRSEDQIRAPSSASDHANCAELISRGATINPKAIAFACDGHGLSFEQLRVDGQAFAANASIELGMRQGDRIALLLPQSVSLPVCLFGAWYAGLVPVPMDPVADTQTLMQQLRCSDARAIVVHEKLLPRLEKIIYDTRIEHVIVSHDSDVRKETSAKLRRLLRRFGLDHNDQRIMPHAIELRSVISHGRKLEWRAGHWHSDDIAILQFTAGTTGEPTGVMLTHRNLLASAQQFSNYLYNAFEWRDASFLVGRLPLRAPELPCGWLAPLHQGACVVLSNAQPRNLRRALSRYKCRVILLPAGSLHRMLDLAPPRRSDLAGLAATISFGASLPEECAGRWRELSRKPLLNGYCSTESSGIDCLAMLGEGISTTSLGAPLDGVEYSIRNENGEPRRCGEAGELWLRGPQLMHAYWHDRVKSGSALLGDGWLKTGDIVREQEDGDIDWLARGEEAINGHHGPAYPEEAESVLNRHPAVRDAACVRTELTGMLSAFRAVVVTDRRHMVTEHELIDWCREQLPACAVPVSVTFRDTLPRAETGAILRRSLGENRSSPGS